MIRHLILLLLLFCFIVSSVFSFNILVIFAIPARSHFIAFSLLFKTLAQRGHNVTVISFFPLDKPIPNYRDVTITEKVEHWDPNLKSVFDLKNFDPTSKYFHYFSPMILGHMGSKFCEMGFKSKAVQDFLAEDNHFDVAIIEHFNTQCFTTLAKKFNVPIVKAQSSTPLPWSTVTFGLPANPAYVPNNLLLYSDKMTFLERVENTLITFVHRTYFNTLVLRNDRSISMKYFGELGASLDTDVLNDSLLLIQSHHSIHFSQPFPPNIIEVGGIHIGKPKALPKDIEEWINESEHGVIYFSFGSVVQTSTMPREKRQALINAFKKLPQRVIWKWENDTMEDKSDNIMIKKWMPQFDILSHPKVKAFISHGGIAGSTEAVHNGVPMIVMPFLGDQHVNARALKAAGCAEILYLRDVTEEKMYNALKKILSPEYQKQAKELSERFRDRPLPPMDTAIYWIEYVVRHKGAHFMKTAAVGMPFYQYYLLDVIAFLLVAVIVVLFGSYLLLRFLLRLILNRKSSSAKVKKS